MKEIIWNVLLNAYKVEVSDVSSSSLSLPSASYFLKYLGNSSGGLFVATVSEVSMGSRNSVDVNLFKYDFWELS
jgi:hypothetical protein